MASHNKHRKTEHNTGKHRKPKDPGGSSAKKVGILATGALAVPIVIGSAGTSSAATMEAWNQVAQRESGGDWSINFSGDGMSVGGVQFQNASWQSALAFLDTKGINTSKWTHTLYQGMPRSTVPTKNQQIAGAEALLHLQPNPWAASGASPGTSMFDGGPNPWGLPGTSVPADLGGSNPAPAPTPKPIVGVTAKAAKAIEWAMGHYKAGDLTYSMGAEGPTSYDCSSFVRQAWRAAGVEIPRDTYSQNQGLTHVQRSEMRPGDLILWNFQGTGQPSPNHVSMYIGHGDTIEIHTRPGNDVTISSVASREQSGSVVAVVRPDPAGVPVTPAPSPKPVPGPSKPSLAAQVLALVNAERAKVGAPALVTTTELNTYASDWSKRQAEAGKMSHSGMTFPGNPVGENVAYGYRNAKDVMHGWMTSPGHKRNILDPKFTKMGVGVAKGANGRLYWTQEFAGGPVAAPAPAPAPHGDTYTVKSGDTLWDISKEQLGDPLRWREIYKASDLKSGDPSLIFPGETVNLPKK